MHVGEHVRVDGFTCMLVFDVSQTEGPELSCYRSTASGESAGSWLEPLYDYANLPIEVGPTGSSDGYYSPRDHRIRLSDQLDTDGMVHCLVHELVHAAGVGYREYGREAAEIITETAATIICAQMGLSTVKESSFYLLVWAEGDIDMALKHLKAADEVAKTVEAGLGLHEPATTAVLSLAQRQ